MLFTLGQVASAFASRGVFIERRQRSQANCERLVPYLDTYEKTHGAYPATLSRLEALPSDLDISECEYAKKVNRNGFSLITDTSWTGYAYYDSETKEWIYID